MAAKTCQYTGWELSSPRAKNHPKVARLLDEAASNGTYRAVVNAMTAARDGGATGNEVLAAGAAAHQQQASANDQSARAAADRERTLDRERRAERERRDQINTVLHKGGYRWRREDEESMDRFGATAFDDLYGSRDHAWILVAPDGRTVTVREALTALNREDLL